MDFIINFRPSHDFYHHVINMCIGKEGYDVIKEIRKELNNPNIKLSEFPNFFPKFTQENITILISEENLIKNIPSFAESNIITVFVSPQYGLNKFVTINYVYDLEKGVDFNYQINEQEILKEWMEDGQPTVWKIKENINKNTDGISKNKKELKVEQMTQDEQIKIIKERNPYINYFYPNKEIVELSCALIESWKEEVDNMHRQKIILSEIEFFINFITDKLGNFFKNKNKQVFYIKNKYYLFQFKEISKEEFEENKRIENKYK